MRLLTTTKRAPIVALTHARASETMSVLLPAHELVLDMERQRGRSYFRPNLFSA